MLMGLIPTAFAEQRGESDVNLMKHEMTLAQNEEAHLYLATTPEGGVTWETSDGDVVEVNSVGDVKAWGIGIAYVRAISKDTGSYDTIKITVTDHYVWYSSFDWGSDGWYVEDADGDGYTWIYASDYDEAVQVIGWDAVLCASYYQNSGDRLNSDDYLICGPFGIPFDAKKAELRFVVGALHPESYSEDLYLYLKDDISDFEDLTGSMLRYIEVDSDYMQVTIDLTSYAGTKDLYLAFNYYGNDKAGIYLDNAGLYYEYDKINEIKITDADITPVVGEQADAHLSYTVPSDVHYRESYHGWYNMDISYTFSGEFEAGVQYEVGWDFEAEIGYEFAPDCKVTVNGGTDFDYEFTGVTTDGYSYQIWTAPMYAQEGGGETVAIKTAELNEVTIYPPSGEKAGDNLNVTLGSGLSAVLYDVYWYSESAAARMNDNEVFTVGNYYSMCIILDPLTGYKFTDETKIFINGSESNVDYYYTSVNDAGQLKIWTVSRACGEPVAYEPIHTVTLENVIIAPPVGEKAGDCMNVTVPSGQHIWVSGANWQNCETHENLGNDDVFEAGSTYHLFFQVYPEDGYLFASDVKMIINGKENDFDVEISHTNEHVLALWTMPAESAGAPSVMIGDLNGDGKVNTADAVVVLKSSAGMITLDEKQNLAGDTNHDGKVNTADAVLILKYAAGMITEF